MTANPYDAYRRSSVETASPGRLVILCFEAAVRHMKRFQEAVEAKRYEDAHNASIKAQRIMMELLLALDRSQGEVADALARAYDDIRSRMIRANIAKSTEGVDDLIRHLEEFRGAWEEVFRKESGVRR